MYGSGMENNSSSDYRLGRIEQKLDQIQEILVTMARIEERQTKFEDFSKIIIEKFDRSDVRVTEIEKKTENNSVWTSSLSKVAWLIVAALVGAIAKGWL